MSIVSFVSSILILGIIIFIHELGHFLLAKKNGITVTEFSMGMGPRLASFVRGGTRYSLKLFPIGGSCMMLGEDETVNDEGAFHKKGVWARFSVIFAGAFFNFILAFVLALVVAGSVGVDLPKVMKLEKGSPSANAGLLPGDRITKLNNTTIDFSRDIFNYFYFNQLTEQPINVTFLRDGVTKTAAITPKSKSAYLLGCSFLSKDGPAELADVTRNSPLDQEGFQKGDILSAINGTKIATGKDLAAYLQKNPLSNTPVSITYQRNGIDKIVSVTPKLNTTYDVGLNYNSSVEKVSTLGVIKYSFLELKYNIVITIKSLGYLISGKLSTKDISGPVGIVNAVGSIVSETKNYGIGITLLSLAQFTILISANLGVMNLLPIPALDGGRLVFIIIEAIRRKPVPKEKEAMVHFVGMVALMVLMVFVMFNDFKNLFG